MKRLKSYKIFNEGKDYNLSIIRDMLLDFSDKDVYVNVSDGSWILSLSMKPVEYIKIRIGRPNHSFTVESSLFDVIDYLGGYELKLMEESWFWYGGWQHYQGCPNCFSEDFEDNYNLRGATRCNKCEYIGSPERFLLSQWPVTKERLELAFSEGKRIEQIELLFSEKSSIFLKESVDYVEVEEIRSTIKDMLLELDFLDITSRIWIRADKMIQVELKKPVSDKSSAVLFNGGESFSWSDVSEVIAGVSDYLSEWGFVPTWSDSPELVVRANWEVEVAGDRHGYDTTMFLNWKKGGGK